MKTHLEVAFPEEPQGGKPRALGEPLAELSGPGVASTGTCPGSLVSGLAGGGGRVLAMSERSRRSQHLPRQPLRAIIPVGRVTPPFLSSWPYYFRALAASPAAGTTWVRVTLFHSR